MSEDNHDSTPSDDTAIKKIFRKNHWTSAEDEVLKRYVKTYGEGKWHKFEECMGLARTGKSCRLRWVDHLSPNLKKGAFTEEEEQLVVNFHAFWENSWARIAKELPGRTNDEIKNFWNTRVRRLQRRGLPIYQMEAREQAVNATTQYVSSTNSLDAYYGQDSLVANNNVPINQCSSFYQSVPCNVPTTGQCLSQRNMNNLIASPNFPEPEITFPFTGGYAMNEHSPPPLWNYSFVESTPQQLPDSHLLGNSTYPSTFGTLIHGAENLHHLSSLQCLNSHEDPSSYGVTHFTPMSALDTNNTWVISDFPPPLDDGSLETSFYGSNTDLGSSLFQSSSLGYAEFTPTGANTTGQSFNFESDLGYYGSTSSNESTIPSYGDWI